MKPEGKELEEDLVEILREMIGTSQAKIFARLLTKYPYASANLPSILHNDFREFSMEDIKLDVQDLIENDLLEKSEKEGENGIKPPIEYEDYSKFLLNWLKVRKDKESINRFKELQESIKKLFKDYEEKGYVQIIPSATSEKAEKTYREDISPKERTNEVIISAFSLETQPEFVKDKIISGLKSGVDYRILLIHPKLAAELEKGEHKGVLEDRSKSVLKGIRERSKNYSGKLELKWIKKRDLSHFRGLLTKSEKDGENICRAFIKKPHKRGVGASIVRVRGENTLYNIIEDYVESAWSNAIEPGPLGYLKKYWRKAFVIILLTLFISLWATGAIPLAVLSVVLAFFLPLASQVFSDIL